MSNDQKKNEIFNTFLNFSYIKVVLQKLWREKKMQTPFSMREFVSSCEHDCDDKLYRERKAVNI